MPHARDFGADGGLHAVGRQRHVLVQRLVLRAVHVHVVDVDDADVGGLGGGEKVAHRFRPGVAPDLAAIFEADGDDGLRRASHRTANLYDVEDIA
jgi:hypothetical protein